MLTRVVTAAAVAVGVVCPAHAEMSSVIASGARLERPATTQSVLIGAPGSDARLDRMLLDLRSESLGPNATLTLVLSSSARIAKDVITSIEVPRGARVTGLALVIGSERTVATAMSPTTADDRYRAVVQGRRDPALLALRGWSERHDRLGLHVYPLVRGMPATVTIDLYLPEATRLDLVGPVFARREVTLDGRAVASSNAHAIDLPPGFGRSATPQSDQHVAARDSRIGPVELRLRDTSGHGLDVRDLAERHVDGATSLFAGAPSVRVPTIVLGCGFGHRAARFTLDKKMIRKVVRAAVPRLRHCYLREAQRTPSLEGSADLDFTIAPDGRITQVSIEGTLASGAARACMAHEVRSWTFTPSTASTQVHYPLMYRLTP